MISWDSQRMSSSENNKLYDSGTDEYVEYV